MTTLLHNIDDVRAEIMRLESAPKFDAVAWAKVLDDLESAGRVAGLADVKRRMETARENQYSMVLYWGCVYCGTGNSAVNDICADCKKPRTIQPCPSCNGYGTFQDQEAEAIGLCPDCDGTGGV